MQNKVAYYQQKCAEQVQLFFFHVTSDTMSSGWTCVCECQLAMILNCNILVLFLIISLIEKFNGTTEYS